MMISKAAIATLLPPPTRGEHVLFNDGDTNDIIKAILHMDARCAEDTKLLAPVLTGGNLLDTCRNIHQFVSTHVRYKEDPAGRQYVQSPRALFNSGVGDCKSFSVFCSSVLKNLGIRHLYRFTAPTATADYGHVYVIVPNGTGYITLDATLPHFNREAKSAKHLDRQGAMPKASINGPAKYRISAGMLSGKQIDAITQQLRTQGKGNVADVLQIEWTQANRGNYAAATRIAQPAIAGKFGDSLKKFFTTTIFSASKEVARKILITKLGEKLPPASPYFLYLLLPMAQHQNAWTRFALPMDKLQNAIKLYVEIGQASGITYLKSNAMMGVFGQFVVQANNKYKANDMPGFYEIYKKNIFPLIFGTDLMNVIILAFGEYYKIDNVVSVLNAWIDKGLKEEWILWTQPAAVSLAVKARTRPYTDAEKQKARGGTGNLQLLIGHDPKISKEAFDRAFKPGGNSKSVYVAVAPNVAGPTYKQQNYTAARTVLALEQVGSTNMYWITLNYPSSLVGEKDAPVGMVSDKSPNTNNLTAAWFMGFGYTNPNAPAAPIVSGASIGEVVTVIIAVGAAISALVTIIGAIVAVKGTNVDGNVNLGPSDRRDVDRCYITNTNETACQQRDGTYDIYNANGDYLGNTRTPPEPSITAGAGPWLIGAGLLGGLGLMYASSSSRK